MQTNFRNSTGTQSCGKQWTYGALNIFELFICKYDHLNNTRCAILRVTLNFIKVRHLIYLYIYKFYNYIHGKYIWNRSVMLTNNACFMKRNIVVKHMTRKVYAIMKNIVASTTLDTWNLLIQEFTDNLLLQTYASVALICGKWSKQEDTMEWRDVVSV